MIREETAPHASIFIIRTQHEMVKNELPAASEKIKKRDIACGRAKYETIRIFDAYHGELAAVGTQICEGASGGFFANDVLFQCFLPFFRGDDLWTFVISQCQNVSVDY
jgi:hypothetical protein